MVPFTSFNQGPEMHTIPTRKYQAKPLPTELLNEICSYLVQPRFSDPYRTQSPWRALFSWSLANSRFRAISLPFLFHHVKVKASVVDEMRRLGMTRYPRSLHCDDCATLSACRPPFGFFPNIVNLSISLQGYKSYSIPAEFQLLKIMSSVATSCFALRTLTLDLSFMSVSSSHVELIAHRLPGLHHLKIMGKDDPAFSRTTSSSSWARTFGDALLPLSNLRTLSVGLALTHRETIEYHESAHPGPDFYCTPCESAQDRAKSSEREYSSLFASKLPELLEISWLNHYSTEVEEDFMRTWEIKRVKKEGEDTMDVQAVYLRG